MKSSGHHLEESVGEMNTYWLNVQEGKAENIESVPNIISIVLVTVIIGKIYKDVCHCLVIYLVLELILLGAMNKKTKRAYLKKVSTNF